MSDVPEDMPPDPFLLDNGTFSEQNQALDGIVWKFRSEYVSGEWLTVIVFDLPGLPNFGVRVLPDDGDMLADMFIVQNRHTRAHRDAD